MNETITQLQKVILERKEHPQEGSYTCYLFDRGLDKILKKLAEESGETIIAAKNGKKDEIVNEACDLIYHLLVLLAQTGVGLDEIEKELGERSKKIGNLKPKTATDRNS